MPRCPLIHTTHFRRRHFLSDLDWNPAGILSISILNSALQKKGKPIEIFTYQEDTFKMPDKIKYFVADFVN